MPIAHSICLLGNSRERYITGRVGYNRAVVAKEHIFQSLIIIAAIILIPITDATAAAWFLLGLLDLFLYFVKIKGGIQNTSLIDIHQGCHISS